MLKYWILYEKMHFVRKIEFCTKKLTFVRKLNFVQTLDFVRNIEFWTKMDVCTKKMNLVRKTEFCTKIDFRSWIQALKNTFDLLSQWCHGHKMLLNYLYRVLKSKIEYLTVSREQKWIIFKWIIASYPRV